MLYIYFEDWSEFMFMLDRKGIPHGDKIIKVYTSPSDPRQKLQNPNIKVLEGDDSPLDNETFDYEERGKFRGSEIEDKISNLSEYAKRSTRTLFRFSNKENLQFCQTGMSMKKPDGSWLIDHPIDEIDSVDIARELPNQRSTTIHLDIFNPNSLEWLSKIVDISINSIELLDAKKGIQFKKELQIEINANGAERE